MRPVVDVITVVARSRELRAVGIAYGGFNAAEWGTWIATIVYAYEQGGATTAGLIAFALLVPAAVVAPLAAVFGDRHRPGRVLALGYLAQGVTLLATAAAMLADVAPVIVYVLAGLATVAMTFSRPAQSALVPSLAVTQAELTAANAAIGWLESVSVLLAPALAGLILAVWSVGGVFVVFGAIVLVCAWLVLPVPGPRPSEATTDGPFFSDVREGLRVVRKERDPRVLVLLLGAQFVGLGALDVLYVVLAIGALDAGDSWAGYLNAAFGAGGTLAIFATASLVGTRHLLRPLLAGLAVWAAAFVVLAFEQTIGLALGCLALAGAGRAIVDVTGRTLLQRAAPGNLVARVFGLLEGLSMAGLAIGSALVPAMIALGGVSAALVGVALVLPLSAAVAGRRLLTIDRRATVPIVELGLLRTLPMFSALAPPVLEGIARSLSLVAAERGEIVIRRGDVGDRWYVVADGELSVSRDDCELTRLGRGSAFGEIALLEDIPRTATVTALAPSRLFALDKEDFLDAVSSHPRTLETVHGIAASHRSAWRDVAPSLDGPGT